MTPTVGRIVHFVYHNSMEGTEPHAALVASVNSYRAGWMTLHVFARDPAVPNEVLYVPIVASDHDDGSKGTWMWPEGTRDRAHADALALSARQRVKSRE